MSATNIAAVIASLEAFVDSFDFTRPGKDQSLGRDIVNDVALGIQERAVQDQAGPTGIWLANEPEYAARKEKDYGVYDQPNVRTGQMLSLASLKGTNTRIEKDRIEIVYGTDTAPTGTGTGAALKPADEKITDTEKAWYAHHNSRNPERPFFQADQPIADRVRETIVENLNDYIRDTNAQTAAAAGAAGLMP